MRLHRVFICMQCCVSDTLDVEVQRAAYRGGLEAVLSYRVARETESKGEVLQGIFSPILLFSFVQHFPTMRNR